MAAVNVGTITYTVEADTAKLLEGAAGADRSLDGLVKRFDKTDKAANDTTFQLTKTAAAVKQVAAQAQAAQSPLGGLGKLLGGLATLQGLSSLVQMADAYGAMAERVKMATKSQEEYELVQKRLLETSNGTYRALSEAQEIFIGTSDNLRDLGYSLSQSLDITDSLSYSFVANATAADRAQSALRAYDLALNKGKLDAMGWLTVIGAVPTVVADIAAASGKTSQEIRQMGAEGKITAAMLNEGLRNALEKNKAAADGMATTMADAFTSAKNNLSAYIGEANRSTGATAVMANAIKLAGDNIDTMAKLLLAVGAGALARYVVTTGAAAIASVQAAIAARAQATAELQLAQAHASAAAAAASHAAATVGLTGSISSSAAAASASSAAMTRLAAAQGAARASGAGLLGILGGPVGIVALLATAAAGVYLFGSNSAAAAPKVDLLTGAVNELGDANLKLMRTKLIDKIGEMEAVGSAASKAGARIETLKRNLSQFPSHKDATAWRKEIESADAAIENENKSLGVLRTQLAKVEEERGKRSGKAPGGGAPKVQADPEVAKRLAAMRDELALAKLTGDARARLQAIQKLGTNATAEERAEAEKLATQIYSLENAQKGAGAATKKSASEQVNAANQNAKAILDLRAEVEQAALSGEALAVAKAKAKLNKFATPAEVATVKELAAQLEKTVESAKNQEVVFELGRQLAVAGLEGKQLAEAGAAMRLNPMATPEEVRTVTELAAAIWRANEAKSFGKDATKFIQGDGGPMAPGADPEIEAEMARYAGQLERLQAAKEAEVQVLGGYQALELQMAQQHATAMQDIEQARFQMQMSTASSAFGQIADATRGFAGEQSGIYKAMFAASKAFAIAESIVAIQTGIAQAAALPFPANIPAMATVAAATAGIIGTISSTSIKGGRQYGGPVGPGSMHRINENGAPEILNTASGQQYLLPNSRGQVVSNADATSGRGSAPAITINLIEDKNKAGQIDESQNMDGGYSANIFVRNIRAGREEAAAMEATYGLVRRGR